VGLCFFFGVWCVAAYLVVSVTFDGLVCVAWVFGE
jgi:hypothetical protein